VTGGASIIGRETALRLTREGAKVAIVDVTLLAPVSLLEKSKQWK